MKHQNLKAFIMEPLSKQEQEIENLVDEIRSVFNYDLDNGRVEYNLTTIECISRIKNFIEGQKLYLANIFEQPMAVIAEDKIEEFKEYAWEMEGADYEYDEYDGEVLSPGWPKEMWLDNNVSFEQFTLNKFE